MKKILVIFACITLLAVIICSVIVVIFPKEQDDLDYVCDNLGITIDNGEVIYSENTHGGMGNDGDTLIKIAVKDENITEQLERQQWEKEPSILVTAFLYGYEEDDKGFSLHRTDSEENPVFPIFSNAYYVAINRGNPNSTIQGIEDLYKETSWNITIGVYDADAKVLYYYEYDS